ncbi:MAG: translation initiation factor IF-2 [Candidatus Eisenbacteria bacterium]|nr:translation initiation factor IF-2 [Candidatus Eisenbacteria bacterium]
MKKRIYEVAKQFSISSEALLEIVRGMNIPVKSHMSAIDEATIEAIKGKFEKEKEAAKEEFARKREKILQREEKLAPKKPVVITRPTDDKTRAKPSRKKRVVDEKTVIESVKKTLASLETGKHIKKKRKKETDVEEEVVEQKLIKATEFITVSELAGKMEVKPQEIISTCLKLGLLANINRRLDKDEILAVTDEFGFEVEFVQEYGLEVLEEEEKEAPEVLVARPPVVTVMGHVDHGKTSLLDFVRKTNVIAGEAGGITQHIGAYEVFLPGGKIIFLDTPGHEAFTSMRARGAQATDIVALVVAADDRVMPQTIEAVDHARAAAVPIVVGINKIDLPNANPDLVRQDLSKIGLLAEEWGGKTICVDISAKTGKGVDRLLEMILLTAEMLELKADPTKMAKGVVIESRMEGGRGIAATVLVQNGTLKVGDAFVAGGHSGKVRAMYNERGLKVQEAPPSTPVEVLGWSGVPQSGDSFAAVKDERTAREIAGKRQQLQREHEFRMFRHITLPELYDQIKQGGVSELNLIIKADVDGSAEALSDALTKIDSPEVKLNIIHRGVGHISESDALLAAASNAVIIGFHVRPDAGASELAAKEKVDIRLYKIIYEAVSDLKHAMSGLLKPELRETILGSAEVREVFRLSGGSVVAGSYILNGSIKRNNKARVLRNQDVVHDGRISSLRRFKEDVKEVTSGFECGITVEGFDDIQKRDVIEAYTIEEVARELK